MSKILHYVKKSYVYLVIADIISLTLIYNAMYYIKASHYLSLSGEYIQLYFIVLSVWLLLSIYNKKYKCFLQNERDLYIRSIWWTLGYSLFFITIIISTTGLLNISRLFILQILGLAFVIEITAGFLLDPGIKKDAVLSSTEKRAKTYLQLVKLNYIIPSALWVFIIFFFMVWVKTSRLYYYQGFEKILLVLYASWALAIAFTYKYSAIARRNIYYFIAPYLKSGFLMLLFVSIFFFFLRLEPLSRFLLFGTAIVHAVLELVVFTALYFLKGVDTLPEHGMKNGLALNREMSLLHTETDEEDSDTDNALQNIRHILSEISSFQWTHLAQILTPVLREKQIMQDDISILSTQTQFNIDVLPKDSRMIIINLEQLNNIRRINRYFLSAHEKIKSGGWIVGQYVALEDDRARMRARMPKSVFTIIYPVYFTLHRVFPKISRLNNLYFAVTKGKNRKISQAEVLGRLAYCGFQMVEEQKHGTTSYFVARKVRSPSLEINPSYGPIVQLERIGYQGERIKIFKFRTMHPYSEFIQKEIYEKNHLTPTGKIRNDIRLTQWGKVMRRFWIDELPQLLNWFRGDVNFIGVRALSEQYYSLYPPELQEKRIQFKPGLVPPFYADLPQSLKEIFASEARYLESKEKAPFKTDVRYFFKSMVNIIFKHARSA